MNYRQILQTEIQKQLDQEERRVSTGQKPKPELRWFIQGLEFACALLELEEIKDSKDKRYITDDRKVRK